MRYAMIMAGGSGTRLWPMSTKDQPKQLIPFINGRSLIQIAMDRLTDLVPADRQLICAGVTHRDPILQNITGMTDDRFYAEPVGRDTLNAVGYVAAVLARNDPDATIAVFTADHIIEPVDRFREIVAAGYEIAETTDHALVTFGITPTQPATGYGYLGLADPVIGTTARVVSQFKEKPDAPTAQQYMDAGPDRYLWNSGMFIWKAATLLRCIEKHAPANAAGLRQIADAWHTPDRDAVLNDVYPNLPKISVDYAVMEPASNDSDFTVAAVAMPLTWLDVGSWPSYAEVCVKDDTLNATGGGNFIQIDSQRNLIASSEDEHLIATLGVEDLIIIHTPNATLVCHKDHAQRIKDLHNIVGNEFGERFL